MDRLLARFGLPGQAFVPLLTAHACAIPGIMSDAADPGPARSARDDPGRAVHELLGAAAGLRPAHQPAVRRIRRAGRPWRSPAATRLAPSPRLLTARAVRQHGSARARARPMVLELPPYRMPSLTNALLAAKDQGLAFLRRPAPSSWRSASSCGGSAPIRACPRRPRRRRYARRRRRWPRGDAQTRRSARGRSDRGAGRAGRQLRRPLRPPRPAGFAPLGFDWQLTVGIAHQLPRARSIRLDDVGARRRKRRDRCGRRRGRRASAG